MNSPTFILLGLGFIVVAAAWFRRQSDNHFGRNNVDNYINNTEKFRKNEPGDLCLICLQQMAGPSMHIMLCGHALCETPCYAQYRKWRRQCPYCDKLVIRINLPGDDCCICLEPMIEENIAYAKCEHAFHRICMQKQRWFCNMCPICRKEM